MTFQICVRKNLVPTLVAMYKATSARVPFSTFVAELLESAAADYRSHRLRALRDVRPQGLPPKIRVTKGHAGRLRKIDDPEVVQQIFSLRADLTVRQLAQRFSVAASTIRRLLEAHGGINE